MQAALNNPRRAEVKRLVIAPGKMLDAGARGSLRPETMDNGEISRLLPQGAVHQGYALLADPIEPADLEEFIEPQGLLLMLDQVTDPQNVGAILRSAAAFGARAVIMQDSPRPPRPAP